MHVTKGGQPNTRGTSRPAIMIMRHKRTTYAWMKMPNTCQEELGTWTEPFSIQSLVVVVRRWNAHLTLRVRHCHVLFVRDEIVFNK